MANSMVTRLLIGCGQVWQAINVGVVVRTGL